jgi:hypothetical protein
VVTTYVARRACWDIFCRASAPVPPGKDKVKDEVEKVFGNRNGEADEGFAPKLGC